MIAEVHGDMIAEHLMAESRHLFEVLMANYHPSGDCYIHLVLSTIYTMVTHVVVLLTSQEDEAMFREAY